jgi:catechol 2,3-dioxygenase-like lactoylglutathione lyase family enzyme
LQQRYSRLGYVALNVSDVQRSAQFYEKLCGFTRTARMLPETASPPSGSIFLYVLDPGGLTMEHSSGMEEFPEEDFREHRVLPAVPDSIDLWGGSTDSRLGAIGHIENPHLISQSPPNSAPTRSAS